MKILNCLILSGLLFVLHGCEPPNWDINELYRQKIEGTSKVLYKYYATGGFDAEAEGYRILDSSETFQVDEKKDLPFIYLLQTPSKTFIGGVSTDCNNSCGEDYKKATPIFIPIKQENTERQDFKITNIIYQYKGFAERDGGLERFQFEKFEERRDSLLFYNLDDVESLNGKHLDSLKLKKRDVSIMQNSNHDVIKIIFEDLVIDKNSDEVISNLTYYLTPKNKLNSREFSDYGIFKQVIK